MRYRHAGTWIAVAVVAAVAGGMFTASVGRLAGQTNQPERPDRIEGRPNFSGIWQANNEANWDLESHAARPAMITQPGAYPYDYARLPAPPVVALGAVASVPGSLGVVQGDGRIPYTPEALARKQENVENWVDRDPEIRCFLPGIPRAMYMPHPFEITQSTNKIHMAFAYTATARTIHMDEVELPPDYTWMGHSLGRWEGDTLVVEVTNFRDNGWFDRAGNHHTAALRLEERFTLIAPNVIDYEVTIEDPNVPSPVRGRSRCPSIAVWNRTCSSWSSAARSSPRSSCTAICARSRWSPTGRAPRWKSTSRGRSRRGTRSTTGTRAEPVRRASRAAVDRHPLPASESSVRRTRFSTSGTL